MIKLSHALAIISIVALTTVAIIYVLSIITQLNFQQTMRGHVLDLTPAIVDDLAMRKVPMYLVKLDACFKDNENCGYLDEIFWRPFVKLVAGQGGAAARIPFYRLNCLEHRNLCNELSTPNRIEAVFSTSRACDFVTVTYAKDKPKQRIVELYMDESDPNSFAKYFLGMTQRNDPFNPKLPHEIQIPPSKKEKVDLAILVLTVDGFSRRDVWNKFIQTQTDTAKVKVFMHNKLSDPKSKRKDVKGVISVPNVFTNDKTVSRVRAVIQMLRHAIAYGGASHYLVVSGDSVPLYTVPEMLHSLSKTNSTIFESHQIFEEQRVEIIRTNYKHALSRDIQNPIYPKSKAWFVLNEEAAAVFADPRNDHTSNFELVLGGETLTSFLTFYLV